MGSRHLLVSLLTGAVICMVPPVSTGEENFQRPGVYLGVSGAFGIGLFQTQVEASLPPSANKNLGNSAGVNARIGYRILPWLALETQYEWLDRFTVFPNPSTSVVFTPNTVTGNLRLILPFGQIQPYALAGVGVGVWSADRQLVNSNDSVSSTGFAYRLGAGVDFYLSENWILGIEGTGVLNTQTLGFDETRVPFELNGLDYFSVAAGIAYRF